MKSWRGEAEPYPKLGEGLQPDRKLQISRASEREIFSDCIYPAAIAVGTRQYYRSEAVEPGRHELYLGCEPDCTLGFLCCT